MSKRRSSNKNENSNLMTVNEFEKTYGTGSGNGNGSGFAGNRLLSVAEFEEQQRQYNANIYQNQQRMAANQLSPMEMYQQAAERHQNYFNAYTNYINEKRKQQQYKNTMLKKDLSNAEKLLIPGTSRIKTLPTVPSKQTQARTEIPQVKPEKPAEEMSNPYAFYGKGNIDLSAQPKVKNEDGSYSTVDSFSVNIDGKEVLLPSIVNGKRVSEKEAIKHYRETGENLGTFNTPDEASAYAQQLHNLQEKYYSADKKHQNPYANAAQDELLKDPGFRTETVRNSAMDKDISGLSNDAQAMVQMVRYEMQRNTKADAIGKMAAGFAQDHQNFKDPIGAFSEAAPIISAMMDEYTGKTNPEYQARTLTRPFNEQSALEQMADPNSRASQKVLDVKEKNEAKQRERFNLMLQLMDMQEMQGDAYENLGSFMGETPEEYNRFMRLENAQKWIETIDAATRENLLDYGDDPATMSSARRRQLSVDLDNEIRMLENETIPEINKKLEEFDVMVAASGDVSDEELMQNPKYQVGFKTYLDTLGLQLDADGNVVDSEGDPAASSAISFFYDYMENVKSAQNQKQMEELQNRLYAAEQRIEIDKQKQAQIKRYNEMDKAHEILMDPEGSAKRYAELSTQYTKLNWEKELTEDPAEREALETQLASINEELSIYDSFAGLFGDEDYGNDMEFHPEYDRGQDVASANDRMNRNDTPKRDTSVHGIYSLINGGKEFQYWSKGNNKDLITKEYSGAMGMTKEEKKEFNRLYNDAIAEGREPKEAQAFLEGLQPFLNQRLQIFEDLSVRHTARTVPVASSIASLGMSATAPLMAVRTIGGKLLGEQAANDPNSWMFASTRAQNAIEGQVASDLGDVGGFVYQAGMSGLKNFVRGITSMGFGAAAPAVNLLEFAGEAFMSSYQQELENTGNPDASFLYAMTEAGISTLFEVVSVEKLFSDPTKYMNYLLQNMGAEMSEEFFENVFSPYIHEFFNGRNEWKERAQQILDAGGYTDAAGNWVRVTDANAKEAWRQACREWNSNIIESVGSAALSVGGPAAFGGLRLSMADRETGKAILNQGVTKGMDRKAASKLQMDNVYDLVKPSLEMKEGTETRRIAESIDKKMQDGQKVSPKEIGKLTSAIMRESDAQIGGIAQDVLGEAFLKRLKVRGNLEQKDAAEITQALVRVVTTNVLSGEDMAIISRSEEAEKILQEYSDSEERRRFMEETEKARNVQTSLMELVTGSNRNSVSENDVSSMMDGSMMATPEEIEEAEAAGGKPESGAAVIANGKYGEITGFGKRTEIIKDENGKSHKETVVTVTIGEGENAETVDLSSVKAVDEGMARALRFIDMDGGQTVSNALGKTLLKVASEAKNVSGAVADAMSVMWAQVTGQRQAKVTNLDAETETQIREAVQADMDAADEERLENWREFKPGQGTTNYNGISYGTKEFKQALNADIKDEQIVREALTIASIAKSAGVDVTLYYDAENTAKQGVFFSGTGISINLAGTYDKEGTHRSALATFAHELTHNLEANSMEAYKALRTFVMQNLKRFGFDLNKELNRIMANWKAHNEPINLSGAMAEMVAMGCERVLTDSRIIAEIKEQDPSLYGNMKKAIRKVVGMMTSVKGAAIATSSRYAKAMGSITSDVARVWKLAYEEALGAKGIGTAEGAAQASIQEKGKYDFTKSYEQQIDDVINNLDNSDEPVLIGEVPDIFRKLNLPQLPLTIAKGHILEMLGISSRSAKADMDHVFGEAFVKDIPNIIAHPVAIIESDTDDIKKRRNSVVIILEATNPNTNHQVIGAFQIERIMELNDEQYDGYMLNSIHGRRNAINKLITAMDTEDAHNHGVFYFDSKKANSLCRNSNVNVAKANRIKAFAKHGFIHNITDKGGVVNITPKNQTETLQFRRWFKGSWIRNRDHTPKVMYSGILNGENNSYYFTENNDGRRKSKDAYISVKKPYIVEDYNSIEEALNQDNDLINKAKSEHSDGIMTKDRSQVLVFSDTQVKSASGNIGTFFKDTENRKMSIQEQDEQYADAVAREDWRTAEQMLLDKMQRTEGITGYNAPYFYTGEHQDIAKLIKSGNPEVIQAVVREMAPKVPENAVLIPMPPHEGKVLDSTDTMILAKALSEATGRPVINALESDFHESRYAAKAAGKRNVNAKSMGFRQIAEIPEGTMPVFIDNMVGGGQTAIAAKNAIGRGITLAYAQSARSKSKGVKFTSVTYDNNGKLIPLSQRMDPNNPSWKFSMQEPVEVNRDGLIAVHNLGEDQLIKTLQLGGFPMPSIAIIKNDYAHNRYGDISIVFYPSTIDPRASRDNKVYGGDAWTPTYPSIEYKINSKELSRVTKRLQKLVPESVWNSNGNYVHLYEENLENSLNSSRGDVVSALSNVDVLKIAYMEDTGKKIEYPTRETDLDGFHRFKNDQVLRVLDVLGEETVREAYEGGWDYYKEHPEVIEKIRQTLNEMFREKHKNVGLKIAQMDLYSADKFGPNYAQMIVDAANRYLNEGIQTETDSAKMWEQLKDLNEDEDYQAWVRNQFGNIIEKKGIRNSKDVFTNNGNRRSWDALHDEETLENVVRMMKAQADKGSNSFFSQSEMLAIGTRDLKSIEDIRKHSGQLRHISDEEMSAAKTEIVNGFGELMDELRNKKETNQFIARERALEAMVEAVRKTRTPEGIMRELKRYGDLDVPADAGVRIANLMQQIADLPTEYFEAKPQRAVELNEIAKVIVPETASKELLKELDMRDIPYEFYDGTDEGRLQALNNQEDAQFSFMDETDVDARAWMETVQESSLQTEAEKSLLRNFKALRMRVSLKQEQERKYRGEIARLEAIPEGERTREQKSKLAGYKVRLENATKIKEQAQEELSRITSSSGYVSMMYRQQRVLNDFVYGRTQEEVRSAVERLERSAETIEKRIRANREAAEVLEKSGIVDRFRKLLGTTTADQTAAELKKAYNSTWTKAQIRTYLDPIIAKMMAGENFEQDVEELAGILVNSDSTNTYEELSGLRGLTITIGKGALAELRAQNSSLKEVRARLAGTGITVKSGERSTLEADIEDLRAEYPSLPELGDEKDALGNFLDWIDGMKQASAANEFYEQRIAEAMAMITGKAAGAAKGIYMPNDSRAQKQVLAMMDFVKSLNAETAKAQKDLQDIADELEKMRKAGQQASGMANTMAHDANVAIDYFNRMARIAEDTAKQKTRKDLVEQLKSEHAQKIAKNNEEWRNLIERDKNARKQMEVNRSYKNRINTVLKRAYNRLKAPKGLQNIPEYMQGLARELIGTFIDNDIDGGTRFTSMSREALMETRRVLDAWEKESGKFDMADMLEHAEEAVGLTINQDLNIIYEGRDALNGDIRGKNKLEILQKRGEILKGMQEAASEIWSAIMTENTIQIRNRRITVEDEAYKIATSMGNKQAKEWTGKAGWIMRTLHKAIISGNLTPEYFFRTLGNAGLNDLWEGYHEAENRNGLELAKAKARMEEIAKKYGYSTWDVNQKVTLDLASGAKVQMTIGQLMSLYATWKRETALGPAVSEHLAGGGFYAEQDLRDGVIGKTTVEYKAHRIAVERDEKGNIVASPDMMRVEGLLTEDQLKFVDEMVGFMSTDMSELGNEASMKAYGIKLYKEGYYFPFQMWEGVKDRKSNDSGSAAAAQDRAFHPSFAKTRMHGANNAIIIGDFMQTVTDHVAGMINYATMGLANENLQKALNFKLSEEYSEDEANTRNVWTMIREAYGSEAYEYLRKLQEQLNGGAVKIERTFYDKAISMFRKNAVAGSLSVAFQQPLSYIRAAMLINPKYLAQAATREYWTGAYKELMAHSGVAVIKDMGKFDMNAGQSAREYLMPDELQSKGRKIYEGIAEYATILPEKMDAWTWTRIWIAVKQEQKALHSDMDIKSDEFLDLCAERFNEVMRRTQVYDSVLVRSENMRSTNPWTKSITSFMAEPTLTLNVLADAVRSAKQGEAGGKLLLAKAGANFMLSAVIASLVKAIFSTGRTPDEKKTWLENLLYRFTGNIISEANPLSMIPGYNDLVTLLKDGKLEDDAMGAVGKIFTSGKGLVDILVGGSDKGLYRDIEDSAGQLFQLFTNIPVKNIMREGRAMFNWFIDQPYAKRPSNMNVLKYQTEQAFLNADSMLSVVLQNAGFSVSNSAYYQRIYDAMKNGDEAQKNDLIDYLLTGKGIKKEDTIWTSVTGIIKKEYKDEKIKREEAEKMIREAKPGIKDADLMKTLDELDYEKENGDVERYTNYTPIYDAIDKGDAGAFTAAKKHLTDNGYKESDVNTQVKSYLRNQYKDGKIDRKQADSQLKTFGGITDADERWWMLDQIDFTKETNPEKAPTGNDRNYRLKIAINNNSATEIQRAVKDMLTHGITKDKVKSKLSDWKSEYLAADSNGKRRIRDAMQKAYKAIGLTTAEADKTIEKWEKDAKKKKN